MTNSEKEEQRRKTIYEEKGGRYLQEQAEYHARYFEGGEGCDSLPKQVYYAVQALSSEYWRNGNINFSGSDQEFIDTLWDNLVPPQYDNTIFDEYMRQDLLKDWADKEILFDEPIIEQIKEDIRGVAIVGYASCCKLTGENYLAVVKAILPDGNIDLAFVRLMDRTFEWLKANESLWPKRADESTKRE
jgi:hypothetical protein